MNTGLSKHVVCQNGPPIESRISGSELKHRCHLLRSANWSHPRKPLPDLVSFLRDSPPSPPGVSFLRGRLFRFPKPRWRHRPMAAAPALASTGLAGLASVTCSGIAGATGAGEASAWSVVSSPGIHRHQWKSRARALGP